MRNLFCISCLLLICLPAAGFAQESDPQPASTPPPGEAPADDLTRRSQTSRQELQDIKSQLESRRTLVDERTRIDEIQKRLTDLLPESSDLSTQNLDSLTISSFQAQTRALLQRLAESGDVLATEVEVLERLVNRLTTVIENWRPETVGDRDIPPALADRIDALIAEATELLEVANERFNDAVALQNLELALVDQLNTSNKDFEHYVRDLQTQLFVARARYLWQIDAGDLRRWTVEPGDIDDVFRQNLTLLSTEQRASVVAHLISLPLIILLMLALRRHRQDESSAFDRPAGLAILLWLLLGAFLYMDGPLLVRSALNILLAITVTWILFPALSQYLRRGALILLAMVVLERLVFASNIQLAVPRLFYLALGLGFAGFIFAGHQKRAVTKLSQLDLSRTFIQTVSKLGLFLSLLGCLALVLGYVQFGKLLIAGVIRSTALLFVLYTSREMLRDVVSALLALKALDGVHSIARNRYRLRRYLLGPVKFLAQVLWIWGTLVLFEIDDIVIGFVSDFIRAEISAGTITMSLSGLLTFALAVWLAMVASRIVQAVLQEDLLPRMALPRGIPHTISAIANYTVILFGIMIGFSFMGINLSSLAFIIGAVGVGIGFGLQDLVNNFVSGLILIFERPIQTGDEVIVGTLEGQVTRIGLRTSRVRTYNGAEVIVPNGELTSNQVINWTLSDQQRRLELSVGVAYGTDSEMVTDLIYGVLHADEAVLETPAPLVIFNEFGDSSLNFRVLAWIGAFNIGLSTRHRITSAINAAFIEAGVQIPFPQRDLHVKSMPATFSER